jgi:hypothetical protein
MPNYEVKNKLTGLKYGPGEWAEVDTRPKCDVCPGEKAEAFYDARASDGRWGYFCLVHFRTLGCTMGTGCGQRLMLAEEIEKVAR